MSLNCFLPKLCGAKKMRRPAGDDRPFPEQDYLVFPMEHMYDRIVMTDRDRSVGLTKFRGQTVANNNSPAWENNKNEFHSNWKKKPNSYYKIWIKLLYLTKGLWHFIFFPKYLVSPFCCGLRY